MREVDTPSASRCAAAGTLGPADGARGMIDAVHGAAYLGRSGALGEARDQLNGGAGSAGAGVSGGVEAVLEVLPVTRRWTSIDLPGAAAAAGDDFEALYDLMRLAYGDRIDEPEQLKLWRDEAA